MTLRFLAAFALVLQFGLGGAPQQKAVVEGVISNSSTGQPVAGARVTLVQPGEFQPAAAPLMTDHNGRFSIQVKEGAYTLRVQANGYLPGVYGQRFADTPPIEINVGAGQTSRNVNVRLTPAANVSGRVRDESDRPMVNVPVQLLRYIYNNEGERTYESFSAVETDDRGQFRMYWVTPGRYYVLAGRPTTGGNPMLEMVAATMGGMNASGNRVPPVNGHAFYPGAMDIGNARPLDLQPGSDIDAIDITMAAMPRTYSLRGKLIDRGNGAASRAGACVCGFAVSWTWRYQR